MLRGLAHPTPVTEERRQPEPFNGRSAIAVAVLQNLAINSVAGVYTASARDWFDLWWRIASDDGDGLSIPGRRGRNMPTAPPMSEREGCADCGRALPRLENGGSPFTWCFGCSATRLADRVEVLAAYLLPHGYLENRRWWRCGDISGSEGQSLAVELSGPKRGRWRDYATGEGGDMLDLIHHSPRANCHGDRLGALRWAQQYLRAPVHEPRAAASGTAASGNAEGCHGLRQQDLERGEAAGAG
jgi:hypothetical protein